MAKKQVTHLRGSANIYEDLGFSDAAGHLARAELVLAIASVIESEGLTQAQAAKRVGLHQPDVSRLLRGRFDGYSIERLTSILNKLGRDVTIVVAAKRKKSEGETTVDFAKKKSRIPA
jgi:predicted XRE-type DNA-binding protein